MSEQNESRFGFGNGIVVTTGFDVSTKLPLDSRTVVQTIDDLANIPEEYRYEGLLVFVIDGEEDGNKLYQWKKNLDADGNLSEGYSWGPIEAEVSAKDFLDELDIDFENTPILMMQKNKKDFFPVVHDSTVLAHIPVIDETTGEVSLELSTMDNKYQTIIDEDLETDDKTIVGSVNEINTKMEDAIDEFRIEIADTLQKLKNDVADMQQEVKDTMDKLKADVVADMAALQKELTDMIAAKQQELEDLIAAKQKEIEDIIAAMERYTSEKMTQMDAEFERLMKDINDRIAALEATITNQVNQMLQDVDNVILSDLQVDDFMRQIQQNLADLED